ncbi:MAG: hypothetical protein WC375_09105 [Methanomassiliicoccales archaeon]|jgi:cellulose synthase/poly-beta-1,6-N-acetylglucosamine synthase-like glycosyltransferase
MEIMVGCPIQNRDGLVKKYLTYLLMLDYPVEKIRAVFYVNNSTDKTEQILREFKDHYGGWFGSFEIYSENNSGYVDDYWKQSRNYSAFAEVRNKWLSYLEDEKYILSVDSDIMIPRRGLKALLSHNKDICSLLVKNTPYSHNIMKYKKGVPKSIPELDKNQKSNFGELLEVDITGACYLINREVIDSGTRYGFDKRGEDVYFCDEAKRRGFKLYCDTGVKAKHYGWKRCLELSLLS